MMLQFILKEKHYLIVYEYSELELLVPFKGRHTYFEGRQLRDLLEEGGYSLSDRSNLTKLIPFINQEEVNRVKEDIAGNQVALIYDGVALIYDGTTHVAEALVIILRYVTGKWEIHQRVCHLKLLAKRLSGDA